ncbi:hypothetical protein NDU88_005358 [Pleurodeles waltl]|uniref:Uncharacterized protein n=1 Tax=Pleurodeles waltl TaxID=8319 RepID=A0AAV7WXD9_PLEWA|nr:hypothetical protein NDU88_005358 [Pleurodeles waltl]
MGPLHTPHVSPPQLGASSAHIPASPGPPHQSRLQPPLRPLVVTPAGNGPLGTLRCLAIRQQRTAGQAPDRGLPLSLGRSPTPPTGSLCGVLGDTLAGPTPRTRWSPPTRRVPTGLVKISGRSSSDGAISSPGRSLRL